MCTLWKIEGEIEITRICRRYLSKKGYVEDVVGTPHHLLKRLNSTRMPFAASKIRVWFEVTK